MKPILFNTEMVRAILDGKKTQTRRPMKPQPILKTTTKFIFEDATCPKKWEDCDNFEATYMYQPGDILYVRETWTTDLCPSIGQTWYKTDFDQGELAEFKRDGIKWSPSIHMPKEAARLFLKVTDVRVERLNDITAEEACKEGMSSPIGGIFQFKWTWDSIYAKRGLEWNFNPWVWVIEFEKAEKPEVES